MFVSAPWRLVFGSTLGSAVSVKRYNLHFKAFSLSNGHEYGESRKNAIRGKIKGVSGKKTLLIDNYIIRCYALGNYKVVKGF